MDTELKTQSTGEQPVLPWFALQVRSRQEQAVATALTGKAIDGYLPLYRSVRAWSDRKKELSLPLFPGYVFARVDVERRLPVLTIPGVIRIVGTSAGPLPVDGAEIDTVRRALSSGVGCQPHPALAVGDRVTIGTGPLRGVTGVLTRVKSAERLVVSVSLIARAIAVEIESCWVLRPGQTARGAS